MSHELRIRIYGSTISLLIARMTRQQMEALMEYCEQSQSKLKRAWYFPKDDEKVFLAELFEKEGEWSWSMMDNIFEAYGIVLQDKSQIQDFVLGKLNRPVIEEVYLNQIVKFDGNKIQCHCQEAIISLQKTNDDEVLVYYGFIDRLATTYKFSTESSLFDERDLEFTFLDCGEYGVVLSSLLYKGKESQRVSKGSTAVHVLEVKFV